LISVVSLSMFLMISFAFDPAVCITIQIAPG
jgi:hypothetical protein